MLSRRVPGTQEPNDWSRLLARRQSEGAALIDLACMNPARTGLSPLAEAAQALAKAGVTAYEPDPRGDPAARAAVGAYYATRGLAADPQDIVLTTGTSESYAHLFRLLAEPGQALLGPRPGYPLFEPLARAEGLEYHHYRLEFDGEWRLDRASLERSAAGARAVIVVEPNLPTGSCLASDDREFLEDLCLREGLAIIADEVFGDYPSPGAGPPSRSWLAAPRVPTFVLGGLSKLCGLPQLKLGWIVAIGPEAGKRQSLSYVGWLADLFLSVGAPVQAALPELLELRHVFGTQVRKCIATNHLALAGWAAVHAEVSLPPCLAGWAALVQLPARRSDEAWALALLEAGVVVHPGRFYDLEGGVFLVLSLIVAPVEFAAGLAVLHDLLGSVQL